MSEVVMQQWVVYDHPSDYPEWFVARRWDIVRGNREPMPRQVVLDRTLEGVRSKIPPGLYCIPRMEKDDPCIVEVWL